MQSERIDGFLVERGPNTIAHPPPRPWRCYAHTGVDAAAGEGEPREPRALPAAPRAAWCRCRSVRSPSRARRCSRRAASWRMLREPSRARAATAASESVAEFVERRLGREACDALVAPVPHRRLRGRRAAARRGGGVPDAGRGRARARLGRARPAARARSRGRRSADCAGTWSAREGLGGARRAARAPARRARFALGARVRALVPRRRRAGASSSRAVRSRARAVVLAAHADGAAALLAPLDAEARGAPARAPPTRRS